MAVIVKYIVVRNGEEKMTFATKKEADAYDKMLDIADNLFNFLGNADLNLDEDQREEIALLLAEKRDELMPIMRGIAPKKNEASAKKTVSKSSGSGKKTGSKPAVKAPAKANAKPKVAAKKKN